MITYREVIIAGAQVFKMVAFRFVDVSEEEINTMKENAIPKDTTGAAKSHNHLSNYCIVKQLFVSGSANIGEYNSPIFRSPLGGWKGSCRKGKSAHFTKCPRVSLWLTCVYLEQSRKVKRRPRWAISLAHWIGHSFCNWPVLRTVNWNEKWSKIDQ